jgi:subtilisin
MPAGNPSIMNHREMTMTMTIKISPMINAELESRGVATVILDLDDTLAATIASGGKSSATLSKLAAGFTDSKYSPLGLRAASSGPRKKAPAQGLSVAVGAAPSLNLPPDMKIFRNLGLAFGVVDAKGLAMLARNESVQRVLATPAISLIRPTNRAAPRPNLSQKLTWGLESLGVERLWAEGLNGEGVRVAHLDTGVDGKHPALQDAMQDFALFDNFGDPIRKTAFDDDGHGTHTAGTIAGRPVKGRCIGVAPGAKLLSGKVIEGGEVIARVLGGMDWAVGSGARVLSMSLGLRDYVDDFLAVTRKLRERGVLPVFAIGNEGVGHTRTPGNYDECLSVGAHDAKHRVAAFSGSQQILNPDGHYRTVPDLVAPGVGVESAHAGSTGYAALDGTSMATPHIAGLAALLFQAKKTATVDEVEQAIFASCRRTNAVSELRAGRGWPNAAKALQHLTGVTLAAKRRSRK